MNHNERLIEKAKNDTITIVNWGKSCKTKEQFNNVEKFAHKHKFIYNHFTKDKVNYWIGTLDGILIAIKKIRFKDE